jgi:CrcB protein
MSTAWPHPAQVLLSTLITAAVAFAIVGVVIGIGPARRARAFVAGLCGAAASLSAYSIIGVGQTPFLAAAFLILTPICAFAGLLAGILLFGAISAVRSRSAAAA